MASPNANSKAQGNSQPSSKTPKGSYPSAGRWDSLGTWKLEVGSWRDQRPGAFSHAASFGAWAAAPRAQVSMRSSDCCSVRSASGTLCVVKNVLISAAVAASQNDAERADDDGVADELAGLLLDLVPALAHELPGERLACRVDEHAGDDELRVLDRTSAESVGPWCGARAPDRRTTSARRDTDSAPPDRSRPCCARDTGRRAPHRPRCAARFTTTRAASARPSPACRAPARTSSRAVASSCGSRAVPPAMATTARAQRLASRRRPTGCRARRRRQAPARAASPTHARYAVRVLPVVNRRRWREECRQRLHDCRGALAANPTARSMNVPTSWRPARTSAHSSDSTAMRSAGDSGVDLRGHLADHRRARWRCGSSRARRRSPSPRPDSRRTQTSWRFSLQHFAAAVAGRRLQADGNLPELARPAPAGAASRK